MGNQKQLVEIRQIKQLMVGSNLPTIDEPAVRLTVLFASGDRWEFDTQSEEQLDQLIASLKKWKANVYGRRGLRVAAITDDGEACDGK